MLLTPLIAAVTFWSPAPAGWTADYKHALTLATELRLPVMINFTGSDWCVYCKRLKAEVFSQKEFVEWAERNVVLLEVDYPRSFDLPKQVATQNDWLQGLYGEAVQGFPTVLMTDPKGRPFAKLGYQPGGPAVWLQNANSALLSYAEATAKK